MSTIAPIPSQVPALTPQTVATTLGPIMVPMVFGQGQGHGSMSPAMIANSSYVYFNRCLLYLSIIFAILAIVSSFYKKLEPYHQTFKNWAVGLLLVYIALIIFNYNEYNQLTGSQILFFNNEHFSATQNQKRNGV